MRELQIASNMIALARGRSGKNKRSAMLRMIMPLLSQSNGEKLASAIADKNSRKFAQIWDHIKHDIKHKLDSEHEHHAHASTATVDIDQGNCGERYVLTGDQMCAVVKMVCERLLMGADPCPLERKTCTAHDWPNCVVCNNKQGTAAFDFNANILELYDTLTASASSY